MPTGPTGLIVPTEEDSVPAIPAVPTDASVPIGGTDGSSGPPDASVPSGDTTPTNGPVHTVPNNPDAPRSWSLDFPIAGPFPSSILANMEMGMVDFRKRFEGVDKAFTRVDKTIGEVELKMLRRMRDMYEAVDAKLAHTSKTAHKALEAATEKMFAKMEEKFAHADKAARQALDATEKTFAKMEEESEQREETQRIRMLTVTEKLEKARDSLSLLTNVVFGFIALAVLLIAFILFALLR